VLPSLPFYATVIALLGAIACGPIGPFAGGRLSGDPGPAIVSDWSFADGLETASLETRPSNPRSVTIWFASIDSKLFVSTSMILGPTTPSKRSWVAQVAEDPRVRIRLGDVVYERVARKIEDEDEFASALVALEAKYDLEPKDRDPERTVWIYRLDERVGSSTSN
jgi:hypothetical protein